MAIPKTQKAAVVEKPGKDAKAVIKEIPVEEPKEGEVLIKMEATGGTWRHVDIVLIVSLPYGFTSTEGRLGSCHEHDLSCWRSRRRGPNRQARSRGNQPRIVSSLLPQTDFSGVRWSESKLSGRSAMSVTSAVPGKTRSVPTRRHRALTATVPSSNTHLAPQAMSLQSPRELILLSPRQLWYARSPS
jgi:hypothetical protein